jgi:O-antigen ligase
MLVLCGIIALGLITIGRQAVLDMMTFQLTYRFGTEDDMLYTTLTTSRVLFFCAVVCLFALLFERQRWLRVASACGFLVFAVFGLACGQRGPVVGFLITCFFLLFFLPGRRRRLSIIFASLITVAAVIPFIAAHLPIIYMRFTGVGDSGRSTIQADLLSEPVSLFGHGIPRYYAHNIVLEFFHDSGLFGLAIFLVALLNAAKALVTSYQYTRSMELVFIMAAALYFLLLQQFSFNIFNAEQLWLALAMATAIATDIRRMRLQARPRTDVVSC